MLWVQNKAKKLAETTPSKHPEKTWMGHSTKILFEPVRSCKFSIIFRCPTKNGQLTTITSSLFEIWILSLLTWWIANSPAFSLVELHLFIQRCSKEFIPRVSPIFTSPFMNFLIKYLFLVKVPFKKKTCEFEDRWVLNSDNITWYIVTVRKLSSNETTWSQKPV